MEGLPLVAAISTKDKREHTFLDFYGFLIVEMENTVYTVVSIIRCGDMDLTPPPKKLSPHQKQTNHHFIITY
jgi:hypothetical protein